MIFSADFVNGIFKITGAHYTDLPKPMPPGQMSLVGLGPMPLGIR
jgi:hypothetical protein